MLKQNLFSFLHRQFVKDPTIQVIVVGDRKVSLDGEESSLTAVTKKLLGISYELQLTSYWSMKGKIFAISMMKLIR